MKKIKIIIEKSSDSYGAYSPNVEGIYGVGDTVQECKQSVLDCIDTILEYFDEEQIPKALKGEYTLEYQFDTESLLQYFKGILSNPAIERLTGINQKLVHQYATGLKKPSQKQKERLQQGLRAFADEIYAISL